MQTLINKFKSLPTVVKIIIIIFSLPFLLVSLPLMVVIVPIYLIWSRTKWHKGLKTVFSVAIVLLVLLLIPNAETKQDAIPATTPPVDVASTQPTLDPPVLSQPIKEQEMPSQSPQAETSSQPVQEESKEPKESKETNPYVTLSKDKDSYLLLLKVIGECYGDNSLSQESLVVMQSNNAVAPLVEDILNYKYESNTLSPDFAESFSLFWNGDILDQNKEVVESLHNSFDLNYNALEKKWTITPKILDDASSEPTAGFEWLSASGNLYSKVNLYIGKDNDKTLYGSVIDFNHKTKQVQLYVDASESFKWFDRRGVLFTDVLYVRSDDPNLPQNQ